MHKTQFSHSTLQNKAYNSHFSNNYPKYLHMILSTPAQTETLRHAFQDVEKSGSHTFNFHQHYNSLKNNKYNIISCTIIKMYTIRIPA